MTDATSGLGRGAWLEIDLDAMRHNVEVVRRAVGANVAVAPVVKADAYGHGVKRVGRDLIAVADALCVATLDEALALRRSAGAGRIIMLYPVPAAGLRDAIEADIELTLMADRDRLDVQQAAATASRAARVHLAVETGMARGGVAAAQVAETAAEIAADPQLELVGLWSHLATPADSAVSAAQVARFSTAEASLRSAGVAVPPRHLAATDPIFAATAPAHEMVRPGLAVYGWHGADLPVAPELAEHAGELRPAMALKARAVTFSEVPVGGSVGYGGQWRAKRASRVAILPVGYADGYLRGAQPGAEALVSGRRMPIAGVISMDAVAVDVTDLPGVGYVDEFVLMGRQGDAHIGAGELARWRNTIVNEVLCSMAPRLARVYNR